MSMANFPNFGDKLKELTDVNKLKQLGSNLAENAKAGINSVTGSFADSNIANQSDNELIAQMFETITELNERHEHDAKLISSLRKQLNQLAKQVAPQEVDQQQEASSSEE